MVEIIAWGTMALFGACYIGILVCLLATIPDPKRDKVWFTMALTFLNIIIYGLGVIFWTALYRGLEWQL